MMPSVLFNSMNFNVLAGMTLSPCCMRGYVYTDDFTHERLQKRGQ